MKKMLDSNWKVVADFSIRKTYKFCVLGMFIRYGTRWFIHWWGFECIGELKDRIYPSPSNSLIHSNVKKR